MEATIFKPSHLKKIRELSSHDQNECVFKPSKLNRIKELTHELVEDGRELAMFFELCPDMFCIASSEGYFLKINSAWQRELGWTIQELTERPFVDFIHPGDVQRTLKIMDIMDECKIIRFHNRYKLKGVDNYATLEWNATRWCDGLTYATAREVPEHCMVCPDARERYMWVHHTNDNS